MKHLAVPIVVLLLIAGTVGSLSGDTVDRTGTETWWTAAGNGTLGESSVMTETVSVARGPCAHLPGESVPVIPVITRTYTFPAGTAVSVAVRPGDVTVEEDGTMPPSTVYVPPGGDEPTEGTYPADMTYPEAWFDHDVRAGLSDRGDRATVLSVYLYPQRYVAGAVHATDSFDLTVTYRQPAKPLFKNEAAYDLLIIYPNQYKGGYKWNEPLKKLVQHKEQHGIKTHLVSLDLILNDNYFPLEGRDDAEKVKYFIKEAVERWGVKYVLLVGGRKPGISEDWLLPVRYVHVFWADETKYLSDLYFADLYDANYSFSSWDTDENDVFSEWRSIGSLKDDVDLLPDVYLGRWACRTAFDVRVMVEKTIAYESTTATRNIVLAGGDNFDNEGIEGELVCDKSLSYLPGYTADKVYVSTGDVTCAAIKQGVNDGAAFVHLHGHGSPIYWSTHKVGSHEWEDGVAFYDVPFFFNSEYPIFVIGGCHTAMFNYSTTVRTWDVVPSPKGIAWWFASKYRGGGIAALGYTAFPVATPGESGDLDGDGVNEPDCMESGYGYMQLEFFKAHGVSGKKHLGECWSGAVDSYVDAFKIPYERYHLHTIQAFVLLGDPTLVIGGY
jgi:hypothetical protein